MVPSSENTSEGNYMEELHDGSMVSYRVLIKKWHLLTLVVDHGLEGEELDPGATQVLGYSPLIPEAVKRATHALAK